MYTLLASSTLAFLDWTYILYSFVQSVQNTYDAHSESSGHGLVQDGKGIEIWEAVWFHLAAD